MNSLPHHSIQPMNIKNNNTKQEQPVPFRLTSMIQLLTQLHAREELRL